jgi:hypothetical protein
MVIMRKFLLALLFCVCLFIAPFNSVTVQAQNTYSLQISNFVWNHSTLNTLIVPADNESWWDPLNLNCTLRAIGQWNEAIDEFSVNNSGFAYLSNLRLVPTVSNQWKAGYDIYVNYTQLPLSGSADEVGLTQIYPSSNAVIAKCVISLATQSNHGNALTEVDRQNIALHELGHGLGLRHSNYSSDLMYALYSLSSPQKAVSTLDAYGVAAVFAWMKNPSSFYPVSDWLEVNSVTLPATITYQDLPVSAQNMAPQSLENNSVVQVFILMFQLLLHPEIAVIFIGAIALFVVIALLARYRKPGAATADS